jgi:methylenetetrahydrofolate reductase (NADPH)
MRIHELIAKGSTRSVEFFPPKTEAGHRNLEAAIAELNELSPSFVSVTYGAGGTTRDLTRDVVVEINEHNAYPVMPHLTCVGHSRAELVEMLDSYAAAGIVNILALAGDPPADGSDPGGDFHYASELVELVREHPGDFSIAVATFPEGHPRSPDLATDRELLASKLEAADFGITNFFFRAEDYFKMCEDLAALGCDRPVLPGIIPMLDPEGVARFAAINGAYFPTDLAAAVDAADEADRFEIAMDAARALSAELLDGGAPGMHLYCLNRAAAATALFSE